MPFGTGPSVVHKDGCDYWRTWFIEECEQSNLFGLTNKHLGLVTLSGVGLQPYQVGTRVYLEDAPYFRGSKTHHRVCGPYEVYSLNSLPENSEPIHVVNERIIIYKEAHPERGPWFDVSTVLRVIDDIEIKYRKIAKTYNYFPYRFAIRRAGNYRVQYFEHKKIDCWLCR